MEFKFKSGNIFIMREEKIMIDYPLGAAIIKLPCRKYKEIKRKFSNGDAIFFTTESGKIVKIAKRGNDELPDIRDFLDIN